MFKRFIVVTEETGKHYGINVDSVHDYYLLGPRRTCLRRDNGTQIVVIETVEEITRKIHESQSQIPFINGGEAHWKK